MIGQKEVLKQIDNLIAKGFPRFIVITGQKGQGKTELAKYIMHKLDIHYKDELADNGGIYMVEIEPKIDNIREMIDMAYKQTEPIIYLIQNADKMSIGAKNSLLKVIEEPPNNAYFIMELQQIENTLETIKSRCQEIKMEFYTDSDIYHFLSDISVEQADMKDRVIINDIAANKYQIDLLVKYKPKEFYNYVDKVVNNIYRVQSANSFKITEKLDLKDDGNGYDLNLFFETFKLICMNNLIVNIDKEDEFEVDLYNIYNNCISITSKYQQKLKINGINKISLLDMWILSIRKEWLK